MADNYRFVAQWSAYARPTMTDADARPDESPEAVAGAPSLSLASAITAGLCGQATSGDIAPWHRCWTKLTVEGVGAAD